MTFFLLFYEIFYEIFGFSNDSVFSYLKFDGSLFFFNFFDVCLYTVAYDNLLGSTFFALVVFNPVHAIFWLVFAFFWNCLVIFFFDIEFLAFVYVLVYMGAIAILFLFVVMMLADVVFYMPGQGRVKFARIDNKLSFFLVLFFFSSCFLYFFMNFLKPDFVFFQGDGLSSFLSVSVDKFLYGSNHFWVGLCVEDINDFLLYFERMFLLTEGSYADYEIDIGFEHYDSFFEEEDWYDLIVMEQLEVAEMLGTHSSAFWLEKEDINFRLYSVFDLREINVLGIFLYGYGFIFIVFAGLLLLLALVGVIFLTKSKFEGVKRQERAQQIIRKSTRAIISSDVF